MSAPSEPKRTPRRGPRSGAANSKEEILAAARKVFAREGFQGTTIKKIAVEAGVDTKMVHYYFGSKTELFGTAFNVIAQGLGVAAAFSREAHNGAPPGETYVRNTLTFIEESELGPAYLGLMRSIGTHAESEQIIMSFVETMYGVFESLTQAPDIRKRANLFGSQMFGLIYVRYILKIEPMASLSIDEVAQLVGPTLDHYLLGDLEHGP